VNSQWALPEHQKADAARRNHQMSQFQGKMSYNGPGENVKRRREIYVEGREDNRWPSNTNPAKFIKDVKKPAGKASEQKQQFREEFLGKFNKK